MRVVPTLLHGIADYTVGLLVLILVFYFDLDSTARYVIAGMGVFIIFYSALTDYELGVIRFLRVRFHLVLDFVVAMVLASIVLQLDLPAEAQWSFLAISACALVLVFTTKVRALGTADDISYSKETS